MSVLRLGGGGCGGVHRSTVLECDASAAHSVCPHPTNTTTTAAPTAAAAAATADVVSYDNGR